MSEQQKAQWNRLAMWRDRIMRAGGVHRTTLDQFEIEVRADERARILASVEEGVRQCVLETSEADMRSPVRLFKERDVAHVAHVVRTVLETVR